MDLGGISPQPDTEEMGRPFFCSTEADAKPQLWDDNERRAEGWTDKAWRVIISYSSTFSYMGSVSHRLYPSKYFGHAVTTTWVSPLV